MLRINRVRSLHTTKDDVRLIQRVIFVVNVSMGVLVVMKQRNVWPAPSGSTRTQELLLARTARLTRTHFRVSVCGVKPGPVRPAQVLVCVAKTFMPEPLKYQMLKDNAERMQIKNVACKQILLITKSIKTIIGC